MFALKMAVYLNAKNIPVTGVIPRKIITVCPDIRPGLPNFHRPNSGMRIETGPQMIVP